MIIPRIEVLETRKFVGMNLRMSLNENRTAELWRKFMIRRNEITNSKSNDKISLQVYPKTFFDPNTKFVKWALIEVFNFENIPIELDTFVLKGGLYAVFDYNGFSGDSRIFDYIYSSYIPNSKYDLDDRPHFEVLGKNYKNNDPDSEEEIYIPIQLKINQSQVNV